MECGRLGHGVNTGGAEGTERTKLGKRQGYEASDEGDNEERTEQSVEMSTEEKGKKEEEEIEDRKATSERTVVDHGSEAPPSISQLKKLTS